MPSSEERRSLLGSDIPHPAPRAFAQQILDADMAVARAEAHLAAMNDHGTLADVTAAAVTTRQAHDALTSARRPLEAALILTRSMDDNVALQVAHAIVQGEEWPYTRQGIREHTGWEPTP